MQPIYWDHNATTPTDPDILAAMQEAQARVFGNPSSAHRVGREARALLDECRERVAAVWGCRPVEVVFTASATEANNLALFGIARRKAAEGKRHLITSPIEHPSVRNPLRHLAAHEGFELTELPVDAQGRVDPETVRAALRPDTALVSVQAANNEVGTLQPVSEIGAICRAAGVCFHTDAVQFFGKVSCPGVDALGADLVVASAHKIYGPKGCGALFVKSPRPLAPLLLGGRQEGDRRPGTENLPAILGFTLAVERFAREPVFAASRLRPLAARLETFLSSLPSVTLLVPDAPRLVNTVAFMVAGCDSLSLVAGLDLAGFCVSSGSACSSGAVQASPVVRALRPDSSAAAFVRVSLGREATPAEVERFERVLPAVINQVKTAE